MIQIPKFVTDNVTYLGTITPEQRQIGCIHSNTALQSGVVGAQTRFRPASEPTLAVKPFEPLGSDPESPDFTDSLTYGILTALNRLPVLTLVQDESQSFQHTRQMSAEDLGNRFAVRFLLKGQVRKVGPRIRVNAELLEVSTGRYLWADMLDRELRDLGDFFAIQDEITEEIVTALDIKLISGEGARIARKVLKNTVALECLYNGERLLWKAASKLELREAQSQLEEVIRLEPTVSIGYAEAALAHWVAAVFEMSDDPEQSLKKAVELAHKAIELDDVTGYPHVILAQVHLHRREFHEAKAEADHAVSDRPSCPASFAIKAGVLNYLGHAGDAIEHAQHAARLSPVYPLWVYPAILASSYHGAARYEEAIAAERKCSDRAPDYLFCYVHLALASLEMGDEEAAKEYAKEIFRINPNFRSDIHLRGVVDPSLKEYHRQLFQKLGIQ